MRILIIILIGVFLLNSLKLIAQNNLVNNPGFESRTKNAPIEAPFEAIDQVKFLSIWKDNFKLVRIDAFNSFAAHSPQWCDEGSFETPEGLFIPHHRIRESFQGGLNHIGTPDGSAYFCMGRCELVQQKLKSNNKFKENTSYTLSMLVRLVELAFGTTLQKGFAGFDWSEGAKLNVFAAKSDIEYKSNDIDDFNKQEYCEHRVGLSQEIKLIASFDLNPNDLPFFVWHKLTVTFDPPDPSFNWFTIELEANNFKDGEAYVCIDEISLVESCDLDPLPFCESTSGNVNLTINESHTRDVPFLIKGLANVSRIKLEIFLATAAEDRTIVIDNPPNIIAWDGKTAGGVEAAAALYGYKITVENECGTEVITGALRKLNASATSASSFFNHNSVSKPPRPCCELEPDIHIQNEVLIQDKTLGDLQNPDVLKYKAINSITTGPNVTIASGSDVVFQAGEIIILTDFVTEDSSNFIAEIAPCSHSIFAESSHSIISFDLPPLSIPESPTQFTESEEEESSLSIKSSEKPNLSISPTPTSDYTTISYTICNPDKVTIFIRNIYGQEVARLIDGQYTEAGNYKIDFDASHLSPGLYYYTLQAGNEYTVSEKMVKLR